MSKAVSHHNIPRRDADFMASNLKKAMLSVLPVFVIPAVAKAGFFASDEQNGTFDMNASVRN